MFVMLCISQPAAMRIPTMKISRTISIFRHYCVYKPEHGVSFVFLFVLTQGMRVRKKCVYNLDNPFIVPLPTLFESNQRFGA